ncbi:MAG: type II/IV secretion system protein [Phycisphaerae bacterium]|nr:type II/IV secretion system protein [Phycisphaerae bacterium]
MATTCEIAANGVVTLVGAILERACEQAASDVHFEPADNGLLVRFRLDGLLHDVERLPAALAANVIARLKVLAGLLTYRIDIPQEGAVTAAAFGAELRVATFPTIRGERAVVRIHAGHRAVAQLDELGLTAGTVERLQHAAEQPNGMILLTGPAGTGKSTTLYAIARHILTATPGRSVVALEDPVEQRVDGMTQIQITPHGELDYPRAMRSLLRQDPQVLLIGEVRDAETASIAVEAALTGHLLLTTMHSGDPAEAVVRLLEMGIPAYQLVSALGIVCTQRLLRTLCGTCCQATGREAEPFVHVGCTDCHETGYAGRTAIEEALVLDEAVREAVVAHATAGHLRSLGRRQASSLLANAARQVRDGHTDAAEVRRVVGHDPQEGA